MWTFETVEQALEKYGKFAPTFPNFMQLYSDNRELFFQLACVGVRPSAPAWMREAAIMGAYLRGLAFGHWFEAIAGGMEISSCCYFSLMPLHLPSTDVEKLGVKNIRKFIRSLDGFPTELNEPERSGNYMRGREVSEACVQYQLGTPAEKEQGNEGKFQTYITRKAHLSSVTPMP